MKMVVKDIDIAVNVYADIEEVWHQVVNALSDAAVETEGRARWLAHIGDDKAQTVTEAAIVIRTIADAALAAELQTSEK